MDIVKDKFLIIQLIKFRCDPYLYADRNDIHPFNNSWPFGVMEYKDFLIGFLFPSCGISTPATNPARLNLFSKESFSAPETLNNFPFELTAIISDICVVVNGSFDSLKAINIMKLFDICAPCIK